MKSRDWLSNPPARIFFSSRSCSSRKTITTAATTKHSGFSITARAALLVAVTIVTGSFSVGCYDQDRGTIKPNQPPNVWLSSAPPEGSTEKYTIQMFWGGWDPDGQIAYYEYAITDNSGGPFDPADTTGRDKWGKVYGNDSIFSFTADELADTNTTEMVTEFTRSHTFFIRAVDDEGLASPRPAYRSFTARTLSPKVVVTVPPGRNMTPAYFPPVATFRWMAEDYVDDLLSIKEPDSVSWILEPTAGHNRNWDQTLEYIRNLPVDSPKWDRWGGWRPYRAPQDSGRFWTTPALDFEPFLFAIRAKDEAGAITPVFDWAYNVRRVLVSPRSTGPIFTVRNEYLGTVTTAICHEPVTIMDLPAGIPLVFCWEASADHYGGLVAGYRYGWDIEDLSDPDQWETDYTPFTSTRACSPTRTFYFGTHTFSAEVIDNSGYCSRVEVKVNIIQFTMENNLLVVDDFPEATQVGWDDPFAYGMMPSDEQHDDFWEDMLEDLAGFNPDRDVLQVKTCDVIPLTDLVRYKSIMWSVFGNIKTIQISVLHDYIRFRPPGGSSSAGGKRQPNVLALFMSAGGHVFLCGQDPISLVINPDIAIQAFNFPVVFLYDLGGDQTTVPNANTPPIGETSFAYKELCLETMDHAYSEIIDRRDYRKYCPTHNIRRIKLNALRDQTMRAAVPIDPNFPRLELRNETAGDGRLYREDNKGLKTEVYNPQYFFDSCRIVSRPRHCFQPIYGLECLDITEPTYGGPVAFWASTYADRIAEAPGAVGARSVVFGFPPVHFKPDQVRGAIEAIVFDEWQLPRK